MKVNLYKIADTKIDLNRLLAIGPVTKPSSLQFLLPLALEFNTIVVASFNFGRFEDSLKKTDGSFFPEEEWELFVKEEIEKLETAWLNR